MRVEAVVRTLLTNPGREPSFLDDIAGRWDDVDDPAPGIAGDVVLLHIATMTNLFAALAWSLAEMLLHPGDAPLEQSAFEAVRLGQRSIMLREVLRPFVFADGGTSITSNGACSWRRCCRSRTPNVSGAAYVPDRWRDRSLQADVTVTTFGHGSHRCPAQRFSVSAIVRTLDHRPGDIRDDARVHRGRPAAVADRGSGAQRGAVPRQLPAAPGNAERLNEGRSRRPDRPTLAACAETSPSSAGSTLPRPVRRSKPPPVSTCARSRA